TPPCEKVCRSCFLPAGDNFLILRARLAIMNGIERSSATNAECVPMHHPSGWLLAILTLPAVARAQPAARPTEPWADARLPVKAGLQLWLDAGRENDARRRLGRPELTAGAPADAWHDASGHKRHLVQADSKARPTFAVETQYRAFRFDGRGQHL